MDDLNVVARLRNVEWELYVLYQSGDAEFEPERVELLWAEFEGLV